MQSGSTFSSVPFVGIVERVRSWLGPKAEGHSLLLNEGLESRFLRIFGEPGSLADPSRLDLFGREIYRINTIVKACVDELATSVAEPRLVVQVRDSQNRWVEAPPSRPGPRDAVSRLQALIQRPAGREPGDRRTTSYGFLRDGVSDFKVFGNAFWRKRRNGEGQILALERIAAPYIEPDRGGNSPGNRFRVRKVYVRTYSDRSFVASDTSSVSIPLDDLVHIKEYDPLDDFWGCPAIVSALRFVDLDDRTVDYVRAFMHNAGTPEGILKLKGIVHPDQRRRIQEDWRQQHADVSSRHRLAVLDGEAEYQETGTRPDKLKMDHVFDLTESRICSAFAVPPILVAVRIGLMRSTDTNYKNARKSFWIETLRPMYEMLGQELTAQLVWDFDDSGDVRLAFDLSGVEDLQESSVVLEDRAIKSYQEGIRTQNEARAIIGLSRHDGGDVFHTRSSDGVAQKLDEEPKLAPKATAPSAAGPGRPANPGAPKAGNAAAGAGSEASGTMLPAPEDHVPASEGVH